MTSGASSAHTTPQSAKKAPPPPPPNTPSSSVTVAKPTIGGIINGTAWTGGQPTWDWDDTKSTRPYSAHCYRHQSPADQQKAEHRQTIPTDNFPTFEKNKAKPSLKTYAREVADHFQLHGMEAVFYIRHPTINNAMLNLLTDYASVTLEQAMKGVETTESAWDQYDHDHNRCARYFLYKTIGTEIKEDINARDPRGEMSAAIVWMHIVKYGASLTTEQIQALRTSLRQLDPLTMPGQNISLFATKAREIWNTLISTTNYDQAITKAVLTNLSKPAVPRFQQFIFDLEEKVEEQLQACKFLSPIDQEEHMKREKVDLRTILTKVEMRYQQLERGGMWPPAANKHDPKGRNAEFNNLVREEVEKQLKNRKNDANGGKKDVECYTCHKKGHYANECPEKSQDDNSKFTESNPKTVEKLPKVTKRNGKYLPAVVLHDGKKKFLCTKCRRYTNHGTDKHVKGYGKDGQTQREEPEINIMEDQGITPLPPLWQDEEF